MKDLVSLLAPKPAPLGAPPTYAPLFQARAFQLSCRVKQCGWGFASPTMVADAGMFRACCCPLCQILAVHVYACVFTASLVLPSSLHRACPPTQALGPMPQRWARMSVPPCAKDIYKKV